MKRLMKNSMKKKKTNLMWVPSAVLALVGGGIAGTLFYLNQKKVGFDKQFAGSFPRGSGAKSSVTGGHPEDINEMPASGDPTQPIFDGSDLKTATA